MLIPKKMENLIIFARKNFGIKVSLNPDGSIFFSEIEDRASELSDVFIFNSNETRH